jgi:hypothetical protein
MQLVRLLQINVSVLFKTQILKRFFRIVTKLRAKKAPPGGGVEVRAWQLEKQVLQ